MEEDEAQVRAQVALAQRGDVDAWEWLYRRIYPRLFSYARRRLPSDESAADSVSETMARAVAKIDTFEWKGAGFDGWLFGICRYVVMEARRSGGRHELVASIDHRDLGEVGPEEAALRADDRAMMIDAFAKLDEAEQELLELRVVAELSAEATGEVVGKRAGAVRMAQSRALTRLRLFYSEVARD